MPAFSALDFGQILFFVRLDFLPCLSAQASTILSLSDSPLRLFYSPAFAKPSFLSPLFFWAPFLLQLAKWQFCCAISWLRSLSLLLSFLPEWWTRISVFHMSSSMFQTAWRRRLCWYLVLNRSKDLFLLLWACLLGLQRDLFDSLFVDNHPRLEIFEPLY